MIREHHNQQPQQILKQVDFVKNPLQSPKVVLNKNSTFEWEVEKNSDTLCRCKHPVSMHLDGVDCCLSAKPEVCICEAFGLIFPETQPIKPQQKIIKDKIKKAKEMMAEDQWTNNYVQTLAKI